MDEEVDYMSDDFIKDCLSNTSDVRPGLLNNRREQRQHELIKKKNSIMVEKKKPIGVYQVEALEEGLKQPIDSGNKGFSMLQKMGFKSGMGLGKNNSGIVEPIPINIKNNKQGLGLKSKAQVHKKVANKLDELNENDFTAFHSRKSREKKILSDFRKSQRICKELDSKCNKNKPKRSWFWPDDGLAHSNDSDESSQENEDELNFEEKLEELTKYLRQTYCYCIWCTVQYNDEKDMEDCPGNTRDNH